MKRYGERGSPCLSPLTRTIRPTNLLAIENYRIVHFFNTKHNPRNPLLGETHSDKNISEVLPVNYVIALLISNFSATSPFFPIVFDFIKCTISIAAITLSRIDLPGTKADWFSDIQLLSTSFNLLARILATTL
ncbi:hypothetical protein QL285_091157 [Trifolium repens]|nr:hypothetical protein QL285_091157 [Trifolium repens]